MNNKQQTNPPSTVQEIDNEIDDDNRDDQEDDAEEEAYNKTKRNGLSVTEFDEKNESFGCCVDSASRSSLGDDIIDQDNEIENLRTKPHRRMSKSLTNNNYFRRQSKNFNYSPDTTDYDSNYGDFDFESESPMRYLTSEFANTQQFNNSATATIPSATVDLSGGPINNYARYCTSMPVLEDGLSSGHASDNENNNQVSSTLDKNALNKLSTAVSSISTIQKQIYQDNFVQNMTSNVINSNVNTLYSTNNNNFSATIKHNDENEYKTNSAQSPLKYHSFYPMKIDNKDINNSGSNKVYKNRDAELDAFYTISKFLARI